jgi:multisubunit Na+/H+ antiporter MnhG subunit
MIIAALLFFAIAGAWLAALGFVRLSTPFDRIHCVTFATVFCGIVIAVAVLAADGFSDRTAKAWLLLLTVLASGATLSHAIGRAEAYRLAAGEQE